MGTKVERRQGRGGGGGYQNHRNVFDKEYRVQESRLLYRTKNPDRSRGVGGHWSAIPPFSCKPVTQAPTQAAETLQRISIPGIVLRDDRDADILYWPSP